jgi:SAM-dependent methyltransferase
MAARMATAAPAAPSAAASAATALPASGGDITASFQASLRARERDKPANQLVLRTIRELSAAFVYPEPSNVETNRKLWDEYAGAWEGNSTGGNSTGGNSGESGGGCPAWLQKMGAQVGGRALVHVGDEWSDEPSLQQVLEEFVFPYLGRRDLACCEIGSGGGRVACRVAPRVASLVCFDVSKNMLRAAKAALDASGCTNARYVFLKGDGPASIPPTFDRAFDFVYSFDVFVHLDLHTIWPYFQAIHRMLRPGGHAFVSTANILAPLGWERFARQKKYSVGGFYFLSPDMARALAGRAGFDVVQESKWTEGTENVYYERDFLFVLRKKRPGGDDGGGGGGGGGTVDDDDDDRVTKTKRAPGGDI